MQTPWGELPDRYVGRISMADAHDLLRARVSRRDFLRAALAGAGTIAAGPILWRRPGFAASTPKGLHLAFGADPRREAAISWSTSEPVEGAVVDLGLDPTYGTTVPAETRGVVGTPTRYHHARIPDLEPGTTYHYRVRHLGAEGADQTFRSAPAAPEPFTFTAFGDQGVSGDAASTTARVEALNPAFHFHVGDLCYAYSTGTGDLNSPADLSEQLRPRLTNQAVWDQWFAQVQRQASRAPWMPTVGNHEMEYGYGPLGYDGYGARFTLPANGAPGAPVTYSFRYGNVGVVALDANDASAEIPSNRGYVGGAQDDWLRATLAGLRADPDVDFIVAGFHHCSYCTNVVHGSDGGTRARWGPLFDEFAVDLVVNGHNHCYERAHPIKAGAATREVLGGGTIDASADGTTYVTAGGGGQAAYQASLYPVSYVSIEPGLRIPETAEWSATRYLDLSLIALDVTPRDGGVATMTMRALTPEGNAVETITFRHAV